MSKKKSLPLSSREAALRSLVRVEQDSAYLNLVLPAMLQGLTTEERALAVQLAAGVIQRLNTLDWALGLYLKRPLKSFTPWIRNLLRMGAYQLIYLHGIPDYAVVDETVSLAHRFGHRGVAGLVNALLRRLIKEASALPWPDPLKDPVEYLSLKESHPQWLVKRAITRFGLPEAKKWCISNNIKPLSSIRPNLLKTDHISLVKELEAEGLKITRSPVVPGMFRVSGAFNPVASTSFRKGLFTVQGESSALVAPLIKPELGDTIIDLCSAPGGKTTHLAELTGDKGRIYAVELHQKRLRMVEKAASRLGLHSIIPMQADGTTIDKSNLPVPDALLVDAPCSGLGVIRRLPEIKWRRQENDLALLQNLQLRLLTSAARLLPEGGKLLYSVCTTEPEETGEVVSAFSLKNRNFILEDIVPLLPPDLQNASARRGTVVFYPHVNDLDGFYLALWIKKG